MPIAARTIDCNFGYVDHESYITNGPQTTAHIFQNTNMAGMVGSIQQISLLADYAAEIFNGLSDAVVQTNGKLSKLAIRTTVAASQIPSIRKTLKDKQLQSKECPPFKQNEADIVTFILAAGTRPTTMQQHYESESMNRMPAVTVMDKYLTSDELATKGSCKTQYSHPDFFINEWVKLEEAKMEKKKEEKRLKRLERQERKAKLRAEKERKSSVRNSSLTEKKKGLNWKERCLFFFACFYIFIQK